LRFANHSLLKNVLKQVFKTKGFEFLKPQKWSIDLTKSTASKVLVPMHRFYGRDTLSCSVPIWAAKLEYERKKEELKAENKWYVGTLLISKFLH
jgi:hypothetical protein